MKFNFIGTIKKGLKQRPLLLSFLINLLFFGILYSLLTPRFLTNDDVGMMLNVAGVSKTVESCPYIMHSHYFIGTCLNFLYSFGVSIPWYGIYLLSMVFLSHVTFLYIILRSSTSISSVLVYTLYVFLIGLEFLTKLHFTLSSGLIGFAGISLLIFLEDEKRESECGSVFFRWRNFFCFVFLAFCVMIRWEGFLMVSMFAVPIFMFTLIGQSRKQILSRLKVLAFILVTCIGLDTINRALWIGNEEWVEFYHFNELRSKLHENNPLDILELDDLERVLESVEWSMNDYQMFKTYYFMDHDVFNANKLETLLQAVPTFKEISISNSFASLGRICSDEFVLCALLIFLTGGIFALREPRKLPILGLSLLIFPLIALFLIYYLRPPPRRVYYTMAAFVSLVPIMVSHGKAIKDSGVIRRKLSLRLALAAVCLLFVLTMGSSRFTRFYERSQLTAYNNNSIHAFMDLIEYRYSDSLFITWGANFYWEYISPFESLKYLENFSAFNIGTSQLKPSALDKLEEHDVSDLMTALVEREDVLLIYDTNKFWNKDLWFRTYLKEHRNINSRIKVVYETRRFKICEVHAIE